MNLWIVMETLFTLTVITTAQGQGILTVSPWMHVYCLFYWRHACKYVLLTDQVSAVALMEILSLSRTQLILG